MKRRICSLLLVLAMLMNMVCVAWAGEVVSEQSTDTGTVTQTIYEVNVLMDEPVIGEPVPEATVPEGAPYYVAQTQWTDIRTNEPVTELVDGTVYWVQIDVLPLVGYFFDGDVELLINGTDDWDYASHGDSYVSSYASICKEYSFCETIDEVNITLGEAVPGQAVPVPTVDPDAPYELTEWNWWDAITYERVETLEDGGVYYFEPMLQVKKGYTFVEDVHLYINGEPIGKFWGDRFSFDPWCEFSFAEKIYEVNVWIDEPVPGQPLPQATVPEGALYKVVETKWTDRRTGEPVTQIVDGQLYELYVKVWPLEGYEFADDLYMTLNGQRDFDWCHHGFGMAQFSKSYSFCEKVYRIDLTVPEAVAGGAAPVISVPGDAPYTLEYTWYDSISYEEVETLKDGHSYSTRCWLEAKDGYAFERVEVFVNGEQYDNYSTEGLKVYVDYSITFTEPIDKVDITLPELVPGEVAPALTVDPDAPYSLEYWTWADVLSGEVVKVLEDGRAYELWFALVPNDGYTFEEYVDISFNGVFAQKTYCDGIRCQVRYVVSFAEPITEVNVLVDDLVPGQPLPVPTVPADANYRVKKAEWVDANTGEKPAEMVAGGEYELTVELVPLDGYLFDLFGRYDAVLVNGKEDWDGLSIGEDSVEICKTYSFVVEEVSIIVSEPTPGQHGPVPGIFSDSHYSVDEWTWYDAEVEGGEPVSVLKPGGTYFLQVCLVADEGYTFGDFTDMYVNNEFSGTQWTGGDAYCWVNYEVCIEAEPVYEVNVLLPEPELGKPLPEATVPEGAPYEVVGTLWTDSKTGEEVAVLESGKAYQVQIDVRPLNGYLFDGDVELLINGTYDWDSAGFSESDAAIRKNYSFCETIDEVNITLPEAVPGQAVPVPTVDADAPYELTHWIWLNENVEGPVETLEDGECYELQVVLQPKDGYAFSNRIAVYTNGEYDFRRPADSTECWIYYDVSFLKPVDEVSVWMDEPVPGQAAPVPTVDPDAPYELGEIVWYDDTDNEQADVLVDGRRYSVEIAVLPKDGYEFVGEVSILLNGERYRGGWNNSGYCWIRCVYSFCEPVNEVYITMPEAVPGQAGPAPSVDPEAPYELVYWEWYDSRTGEPVKVLENGRIYHLETTLLPKDGYEFAERVDLYYNGEFYGDWWTDITMFDHSFGASFAEKIYEVNVLIDEPELGKPLPQATVPEGAPYYVAETMWIDQRTDKPVTELLDGNNYELSVIVMPLEGYEFADGLKMLFNGTNDWDSCGNWGDSAHINKCYSYCDPVDTVHLWLSEPVAGQPAPMPSVDPDAPYEIATAYWYDDTTGEPVETLEANGRYYLEMCLETKVGYVFTEYLDVFWNDEYSTPDWSSGMYCWIGYDFSFMETIDEVAVLVDEVVTGTLPQATVPEGAPYEVIKTVWIERSTEEIATVLEDGKLYEMIVMVQPLEGYEFSRDLRMTINGGDYNWFTNEWDYAEIGKYYSFCETVDCVDITVPEVVMGQAGPKPTVDANAPYEIVGWVWVNSRTGEPVDVLADGARYGLDIRLQVKEGYEFAENMMIYFNGEEYSHEWSDSMYLNTYYAVSFQEKIHKVEISFAEPQLGQAVPEVTVPEGVNYKIDYVNWWDVTADDTAKVLQEGHAYEFRVGIYPAAGYEFAEDLLFVVNGEVTDRYGYSWEYAEFFQRISFQEKIDKVELPALPKDLKPGDSLELGIGDNGDAKYTFEVYWAALDDRFNGAEIGDVAESGKNYIFSVEAIPLPGYEFAEDVVVTVGGEEVKTQLFGADYSYIYVGKIFLLGNLQMIDKVELTAIKPYAGDAAGTVTVDEDAPYTLNDKATEWGASDVDDLDDAMIVDVFEAGQYAWVVGDLLAKDGYIFSPELEIYINGQKLSKSGAMFYDVYEVAVAENLGQVTERTPCNHQWGAAADNEDGTHARICGECGAKKNEDCVYTGGEVMVEPTHTTEGEMLYTCTVCGGTKSESIPTLIGHEWYEWRDNGNDTHIRFCACGASQTEACTYDDGVVTAEPTHTTGGVLTYTCTVCGHDYTDVIDPLPDHEWGQPSDNGDGTHTKVCPCGQVDRELCAYDDGVVTTAPTHTAEGVLTYTCTGCGGTKTESIPVLTDHAWGQWLPSEAVEGVHFHACICGAIESAECTYDDGVITAAPTHTAEGVMTYTCAVCSGTKTEAIPVLPDHEWGQWSDNGDGTHTRSCACGEAETGAHAWGDWTELAEDSYQRKCADCDAAETMVIDKPVNTTPEDNAADTVLGDSDVELIDKVLTDDEQSQVAQGAEVKIYLQVEDISENVSDGHKAEAEAKAGDSQIGMYLDIDLFKQVGTAEEVPVSETSSAVTVTITIPEELRNSDPDVKRTYTIVRVHELSDGTLVTDVIEGEFNAEDNTFTFETDKFSTYALAYADGPAVEYLLGDVNMDGSVDSMDTNILFRYANGDATLGELTAEQLLAADVNGDGSVDSMDTNILFRYANGDATLNWQPVLMAG